MIWDLPYATHTRFLESLSPVPHLENVLHSRYLGFIQNLRSSEKFLLKLIFFSCYRNLSTRTGQNLVHLEQKYQKYSVGTLLGIRFKGRQVNPLPVDEDWKVKLIEEISLSKANLLEIDFEEDLLDDILLDIFYLNGPAH